jgi:pyruvate, orthophosphate dikinase
MAKSKKYVYFFGGGKAEGRAEDKQLLGGKGANLAEMTNLGLPVPPGFTISTEACEAYSSSGGQWPAGLKEEVERNIQKLEKTTGRRFGSKENPLLVSVRSGAAVSMPGMMDTVLNLGINDEAVQGLIAAGGNDRFAWDSYRRFIDMFGDVVMGVDHEHFEHELSGLKRERGVELDTGLSADDLRELVERYKKVYRKHIGDTFPTEPREQLRLSINAVFDSWDGDRAIKYRQINKITGLKGTAVNICTMVFGNMGDTSGTGVAFTRNPSIGERVFYGEYLMNAQGEDVVAGIRTPEPISKLAEQMPEAYRQLDSIKETLEKRYKDMQDVEFTIQQGTLYMLQTRNGARTVQAALKIAVDMVHEGLISKNTALSRVPAADLVQLLLPVFDFRAVEKAVAEGNLMAKGLPAGPGDAIGKVYFSADDCEQHAAAGEDVILVRIETSPEDVGGMYAAKGVLTSLGGMTSHAAVVARGMGKTCVAGCKDVVIDYAGKQFTAKGVTIREGDFISLSGAKGEVYKGEVRPLRESPVIRALVEGDEDAKKELLYKQFAEFMSWADKSRKLNVRTNADTPLDARVARALGAEGIGLCRTEHMFFDPNEPERIRAMREMILAKDEAGRQKALDKLLPFQRRDFEGIFEAMNGCPVTIRLLDPPLHEFLPHNDNPQGQQEAAQDAGLTVQDIQNRVKELHEFNPMLGFRGCRLGVSYPEISRMQVRAIVEAAVNCQQRGIKVLPEIMIPLTMARAEFEYFHELVHSTAKQVLQEKGAKVQYMVGTMIEVPRAALVADQIAELAEFFSFGTNDLTQLIMGLSRDDAGRFLPDYVSRKLLPDDPFQTLDQGGVGLLVKHGIELGRGVNPTLKVGICGEHGGEAASVKFCHRVGMNYVSCSPYRVPIARLAAAQEAIASGSAPAAAGLKKAPKAAKKTVKKAARHAPKKAAKAGKPAAKKPAAKKAAAKKPAAAKKTAKPKKKGR